MKILLVEDDPLFALELQTKLTSLGHTVAWASDARSGIEKGVSDKPDVVISDWNLNDTITGVGVCNAISAVHATATFVIVSGSPRDYISSEAKGVPIFTILTKPLSDSLMKLTLQAVAQNNRAA